MIQTTDIIIYTTPDKLLHKQGKLEDDPDRSDFNEYYWTLPKRPKRFAENWEYDESETEERIYFATEGFIRGYFTLFEIDEGSEGFEFTFDCRLSCKQ